MMIIENDSKTLVMIVKFSIRIIGQIWGGLVAKH